MMIWKYRFNTPLKDRMTIDKQVYISKFQINKGVDDKKKYVQAKYKR